MIVERFIVIGLKYNRPMITNVINGTNSSGYGNGLNLNISLDFVEENATPVITDHKKFDTKDEAIMHLSIIRTQIQIENTNIYTHEISSWSIISVYDDIYDLVQVRKYKILKLKNRMY